MVTRWQPRPRRRLLGLLASAVLSVALQLHGTPAAAEVRCWDIPGTERPAVFTIDGTVRVDNRCNELDALVIVWKMYENSSETFTAPAGTYTSEPTLHTGAIKVWIRFPDGSEYIYSKTMHYTSSAARRWVRLR
jgi:hypothetical protein